MSSNFSVKSLRYDYDVIFTSDFRRELSNLISNERCVFLIDSKIWDGYNLSRIIHPDKNNVILIEATEANKTIYKVIEIWKKWETANVTKKHKVVVIGGGILQDLGAFASSVFLRNIEWIYFPTTLLAQCDSCIGSKCGINLESFKNQLGMFYAPRRIYIDTHFIDTLTENDFYSGIGEIYKASLTLDAPFFDEFHKIISDGTEKANINELIFKSLMIKKRIIEVDEFEKDYRRILNYGHTFGHALEAYSNNEIPHGAAVTIGVDIASYISWKKGFITSDEYLRIKEVAVKIFKFKLPEKIDYERLFYFMRKDKKSDGNKINFVIPERPGKLQIYPMEIGEELANLLKEYMGESYAVYRH